MAKISVLVATVLAAVFPIVALVTLSMERHVVSGTFFLFTAFSLYYRETHK